MEKENSKFAGFPEPEGNFTMLPNIFFDEVLPKLKSKGQVKVLLYIFRRTYGFQKEADGISLTQFESGIVVKRDGKRKDYGTGLSRKTIIAALNGLVESEYILRYLPDKGTKEYYQGYYFLKTDKNLLLIQALKEDKINVEQAVIFSHRGVEVPSGEIPPLPGGISPPPARRFPSGKIPPTTKRSTKKINQKKASATRSARPSQFSSKPQTTDAGERMRELRLNEQRRRESPATGMVRVGDIIKNIEIPQPG